ncbi:suppressor of Mek1-like isoform X2 [Mytilus trossulus]|uniref:suppressor of Mek1-like isoform X2 n=1 Tax=Mytilus trossulus TaxID=6551 RepID=UPI0030074856
MKEIDEVPTKISVSKICLFRKGSDIDLEAIFGGRISNKKTNVIKTNPVYKDGNGVKRGNNSSKENDMGGIEIQVYNNIPKSSLENTTKHENLIMKEQLMTENSRTERDKVTVTNGDVCVGDIIIENGYRNPSFISDTDSEAGLDVMEHTVKYSGEGEGKGNMSGSEWPDIDDIALPPLSQEEIDKSKNSDDEAYEMIDYNRNKTKFKNDIDPGDIEINISQDLEANVQSEVKVTENLVQDRKDEVQTVSTTLIQSEAQDQTVLEVQSESEPVNEQDTLEKQGNENDNLLNGEMTHITTSDLSSKDSNENEKNDTKSDVQNENRNETNHQKTNGSINKEPKINGSVNSTYSLDEDSCVNEKGKSKKKKKLKQRKNSLPDHILNSLNMKPSKPILVPVVMDDSAMSVGRSRSTDNSNEQKSVKFSDDTVFNDTKPNKYKQERLNLKDIYKGKISSKDAVAKLNPVFLDEDNQALQDRNTEGGDQYDDNLNTPAYMKNYLTSHGGEQGPIRHAGLDVDNDIESIGSEGAVNYDKLIQQTIARKRRSRVLRLICAVFTFCVVIGVVVVLVIFVGQKQS